MSIEKKKKSIIKARIAPSPTGPLHLGTARTALFNYLFAKKNKGKFILRIEDTDLERSDKKYEKEIIDSLKWLGLDWDEGPFRQSERTEVYQKYIKKLLETGQAFWCYHTQKELEQEKKEQIAEEQALRHICDYKNKKQKSENKGVIRFHCPDKKLVFDDLIRGKLEFETSLLGDISIAKNEKTPLYNFSVVIDDYEMKITHVIRGEDHISNTPKQILISQALDFPLPKFAHLPLILGPDKTKLSKRHGAVSVSCYREQGYLAEALVNFMAMLGWNPGTEKEIFFMEELIKEFSLERVHKGGAIFNLEKLNWYNQQYIKKMNLDELTEKCLPYLELSLRATERSEAIPFDYAKKIVALEQERMKNLSEIEETTKFFFLDKLDYQPDLLIWKKMTLEKVKANLDILEETLSKMTKFDQESFRKAIMPLTEKHGSGELLWPLRVALTGQKASPSPFEIAEILGKEKTLKRLKQAKDKINA